MKPNLCVCVFDIGWFFFAPKKKQQQTAGLKCVIQEANGRGFFQQTPRDDFLVVFPVASWCFPVASWVVSSRQLGGFKRHPGGFQKNVPANSMDLRTLLEIKSYSISKKKKVLPPTSWQIKGFFFPMKPGIRSFFLCFKKICREGRLQACQGS